MSLKGKYSYDVKFVVFEHELVDVGCFEHRIVKIYDPVVDETIEDACKYAEELKCKQEKQVIIPKNNIKNLGVPGFEGFPVELKTYALLERIEKILVSMDKKLGD